MRTVALLSLFLAVVTAENSQPHEYYEKLFFEHMQQFKLSFKNGAEFVERLKIFANNVDEIEKHNADKTQTYQLGVNQFSHLTFDEFTDAVHIGGTRPPFLRGEAADFIHTAPADESTLAAVVDWVSAGAVTGVKDQGNCGSCWSFSTTGAIEGAYKLKYGSLPSFSEQELVSCDKTDSGCNGGWMDTAFTWVKSNKGLPTESAYPYTSGSSGSSGTCKTGIALDAKAAPAGFTDVTPKNVNALMSAVQKQPVSIAIQANQAAFQSYKSGVLTGTCGTRLDHGVLLVGYGTDAATNLDYWKVKNSWGPSWGESGYIRIKKGSDDLCGVLDAPSYPNL